MAVTRPVRSASACCPCPCSRSPITRTGPTSEVLATWVPPSACLSMVPIVITRIGSTNSGIRFTLVRIRSGSARAADRGRNSHGHGVVLGKRLVEATLHLAPELHGDPVEFEVHPGDPRFHVAAGHLGAEVAPDHRRQHVQGGVGAHQQVATVPVDGRRHLGPGRRRRTVEDVDHRSVALDGVGHRDRSPRPGQGSGVTGLAAATGVEDRPVEHDAVVARPRRPDPWSHADRHPALPVRPSSPPPRSRFFADLTATG